METVSGGRFISLVASQGPFLVATTTRKLAKGSKTVTTYPSFLSAYWLTDRRSKCSSLYGDAMSTVKDVQRKNANNFLFISTVNYTWESFMQITSCYFPTYSLIAVEMHGKLLAFLCKFY